MPTQKFWMPILVLRLLSAFSRFTGAGPYVVRLLRDGVPPCKRVEGALTEICELAKAREVSLLIDAEQNFLQDGIFRWTLQYQKKFNSIAGCKSTVYGTYQAYLRSTPSILAQHLEFAQREGIMLGVKLVRGAYMGSDPRPLFWDTKRETDEVYDGIARALIQRQYNDVLKSIDSCGSKQLPEVNMLLATHNHTSVQKAMKLRKEQTDQGNQQTEFGYGQLMGMADEVSGELIQARKLEKGSDTPVTKAYKYVPWGTVSECIQYFVRRAEENRDAAERAKEGRTALKEELIRRILRRA